MPYIYGTKQQAGQAIVQVVTHAQGVKPPEVPRHPGADAAYWNDSVYAEPGAPLPAGSSPVQMREPHAEISGDTKHRDRRKGTAPLKYHYSVYNDGTTRRIFFVYYCAEHNSSHESYTSVRMYACCNELYEHTTFDEPPLVYSTVVPAGAKLIKTL